MTIQEQLNAMKKYVVCPDFIISRTDGQRHYIGAAQLIRLYNVPAHECVVNEPPLIEGTLGFYQKRDMVFLRPRDDGDYTLKA